MLEHYTEPTKKSNQARHPVTKQITKGSFKANQAKPLALTPKTKNPTYGN